MKKEQIYIIKQYFGKKTYQEIGDIIGMSGRMVRYHCRKTLNLGTIKTNNIWTDKEIQYLKDNYSNDPDIYKHYINRTKQSVWSKVHELGLKAKGRGFITGNYKFFDKWSPTMAYVLGFICADGNIHKNVLSLVQKDSKYLYDILKIMGWTNINVRRFKSGVHIAAIRNEYMINRLKELKIIERKSLLLGKIPVPKKYMSSFILGYFDGDGCFYNPKKTYRTSSEWSILGTYNFLHWLQSEISIGANVPSKTIRRHSKNSKIWILKFSKIEHVHNIGRWLYSNKNYMERKYQKYHEFTRIRCGNSQRITRKPSLGVINSEELKTKDEDIVRQYYTGICKITK